MNSHSTRRECRERPGMFSGIPTRQSAAGPGRNGKRPFRGVPAFPPCDAPHRRDNRHAYRGSFLTVVACGGAEPQSFNLHTKNGTGSRARPVERRYA